MRLGLGEAARPGTRLRAMMAPGRPLVLPGCYNALTARILEHAGH
jgi:2-methylisocitrate lyase-like PEP mutase family enzyme